MSFNKAQIASVNNIYLARVSKGGASAHNVTVPTKETFEYILESAKKGNEMAAVQLDEWKSSCKPKSFKEMQVISMIKSATNEILK